jgi:hypothetical protein
MQRVELNHAVESLFCPFCGHCVFGKREGADYESYLGPCTHTLFVAHDEGFEFRSGKFNEIANLKEDWDDSDLPEGGIDKLTDSIELRDSVKIAAYVPAPSFFGTYFGFWIARN